MATPNSTKGWEVLFPEQFPEYEGFFKEMNNLFYTKTSFDEDIELRGNDHYTKKQEEFGIVLERLNHSSHKPTALRVLYCLMGCDGENWVSTGFLHKVLDSTSSTILPIMHYLDRCNLVEKLRLSKNHPYFGSYAWKKLNKGKKIEEDLLDFIDEIAVYNGFDGFKEDFLSFNDKRVQEAFDNPACFLEILGRKSVIFGYPELDKISEKTSEDSIFHVPYKQAIASPI